MAHFARTYANGMAAFRKSSPKADCPDTTQLRTLAIRHIVSNMFLWFSCLAAIFVVGAACMWHYRVVGGLLFLCTTYLFLQFSSRFFLVPWYKDGGNGVWFVDGPIWITMSVGLVLSALALMTLVRVIFKVPSIFNYSQQARECGRSADDNIADIKHGR